jgi:two-component system, OmpR family, sensor kinase
MRIRSLRNRLALIFGLIVLGAIAIVYFAVAPQLEGRLRDQKLDNLAADARRFSPPLQRLVGSDAPQPQLTREVGLVATRASAEVNVLGIVKGTEDSLFVIADSDAGGVEIDDVQSVAEAALGTRHTARATEPTHLGRQALVAEPLIGNGEVRGVAVYADALTDVQANVSLIRRRILVAGGIAFLIAVLGGYLVARALSLRVKRLERAVRKVASGDFSDRIQPDSDDELGQLGAAFDDMQRQLARLDHARKQFIAQASHELRTPLFSLGGFLELLEDEELDEPTRKQFLDHVRAQVDRLTKLATELLDLSRLEAGVLELRPEPTDVHQLAREVAGEFTPAAARHGSALQLDLDPDPDPIEIECDPERVAQVVRILLDNALIHTPAGTGVVVSAARENGQVRLEVSDSGLGIRRQTMPHIFEPFFTSSDRAQGAGLGLAIARELAERMNGELSVHSVPGATTFSLTLPAS